MIKPVLKEIERDENHVLYFLFAKFNEKDNYERAKVITRFLTTEAKVLERAIDSDIRHYLRRYGINVRSTDKSALQVAFDTLKGKGKGIAIIDRYENVNDDYVVGKSDNGMTVIVEKGGIISIAIEVSLVDL